MNIEDAVQQGADVFAAAEERARDTKTDFRALRSVFEAVRDEGLIGGLECQALASEADLIATETEARIWALHAKLTRRCEELGIDLPEMQRDGGGGHR